MNLPAGRAVKIGIDAASVDFPALVRELFGKRFSGYLALSLKGSRGLEEGVLMFDAGKIVACTYEYFAHDKRVLGEKAFPRILNAANARIGVIDLFQLTDEQVKLVLAFNEAAVYLPNERAMLQFKTTEFSTSFEDEVATVPAAAAPAKTELMKKFGITEMKKETETKAGADDLMKKLLENQKTE